MAPLLEGQKPEVATVVLSPAVDISVKKYNERTKEIMQFIELEANFIQFYKDRIFDVLRPTDLKKYSDMIRYRSMVLNPAKKDKAN